MALNDNNNSSSISTTPTLVASSLKLIEQQLASPPVNTTHEITAQLDAADQSAAHTVACIATHSTASSSLHSSSSLSSSSSSSSSAASNSISFFDTSSVGEHLHKQQEPPKAMQTTTDATHMSNAALLPQTEFINVVEANVIQAQAEAQPTTTTTTTIATDKPVVGVGNSLQNYCTVVGSTVSSNASERVSDSGDDDDDSGDDFEKLTSVQACENVALECQMPLSALKVRNDVDAESNFVVARCAAYSDDCAAEQSAATDATAVAADANESECRPDGGLRLERSNSCSRAECGTAAKMAASLADAATTNSICATTSVSHDDLAAAVCETPLLLLSSSSSSSLLDKCCIRSQTNAPPIIATQTATTTTTAHDKNISTTSALVEIESLNSIDVQHTTSGCSEQQATKNSNNNQATKSSSSFSSSRFFPSKLNTGSLWSLLSIGSSTSTINEIPANDVLDTTADCFARPTDTNHLLKSNNSLTTTTRQQLNQQQQSLGNRASFFARQFGATTTENKYQHSNNCPKIMATSSATAATAADIASNGKKYRFSIKYIGTARLHKNFTLPMLEWIVKDVKRQTSRRGLATQRHFSMPVREILLEIHTNQLTAISCKDGHCIFVHPMHCVSKYAQMQHDPTIFSYISRDTKESPAFCHAFQAKSAHKVHEIFSAIREVTTRCQLASSAATQLNLMKFTNTKQQQQQVFSLTSGENLVHATNNRLQKSASTDGHWKSLAPNNQNDNNRQPTSGALVPLSQVQTEPLRHYSATPAVATPASVQFENSYQFEVMFVKRVKLQCRRVPPTFVDDALETLKTFDVTPKATQMKGVTKRIISASVDERQEYDEACQSPPPPVVAKQVVQATPVTTLNQPAKKTTDDDDQRRGSSVSLLDDRASCANNNSADERESKSCQPSPRKEAEKEQQQQQQQVIECKPTAVVGNEQPALVRKKLNQSMDCLRSIDNKQQQQQPVSSYPNDFSPYHTITSGDLNERIAAIPVVSGSVSLDHETRQKLARQVRETIMATAANIKRGAGSATATEEFAAAAARDDTPKDLLLRRSSAGSTATTTDVGENKKALQEKQQVSNNFDLFRRASARQVVKNRTMLLLIGKDDLCAISIDKHQMLFSKSFTAIVHCLQGQKNCDHFGVICRDSGKINPQTESYAGYVFKCQSEKVVREIMGALKQVIYNSQHNYHGQNSPYNPLNLLTTTTTSQTTNASSVSSSASSSSTVNLKTSSNQSTSLASKRGFTNALELSEAQQASSIDLATTCSLVSSAGKLSRSTAAAPPPSAPALNTQPTSAFGIGQHATQVAPPTKNPIKSMFCDDCPLYWYHRLCCDIESLPAEASKAIILRRIDSSLSERDQDEVYSKFSELEINSIDEHNEIFMSILRQQCERKQVKHSASSTHLQTIAKNISLARQQSGDFSSRQQHSVEKCTLSSFNSTNRSGHQRSGSSSGSLAHVIGEQTANANQALTDASSAAIDNLKRAKNSISVSIENMLKRRASLKDIDNQEDTGGDAIQASLPQRSGSLRASSRQSRVDLMNNSDASDAGTPNELLCASKTSNRMKRSQSSHDYSTSGNNFSTSSSWRDSLARTINDDLTNPLVGFFRRRGSFARTDTSNDAPSDLQTNPAQEHSPAHTDLVAGEQSPTRQQQQQQQQQHVVSRLIQPAAQRLAGHASPSSLLSGSFWKKSIFDKIHQQSTAQQVNQSSDTTSHSDTLRERLECGKTTPTSSATVVVGDDGGGAGHDDLANVRKRTREELRNLWKKAILEQITLLKMDKQNQQLQALNSIECNIQRMKLNYRDVLYDLNTTNMWDKLLKQDPTQKVHFSEVAKLVRSGVHKVRRGEIWMFLMNQYQLRHGTSFQPAQSEFSGDADQTYRSLLSQLSTQQHEIFVDIGRTFPSHPYYSQYLSIGQLSLFNLLKAYSLLDKEVGYCQGLSFVAGILLLHVDSEDEAFELMRHLLFNFGLRKQYLPSMNALHLQLYQITRLLRDHEYDIFAHFDHYDISPSLYAAPWFLTLFASQFPLGFVARLLDLVFLIGIEAIFRVSLTLLAYHRIALLACESLEGTMEFMKDNLTRIDDKNLAKIFDDAMLLDLRNKLIEYEIEYSFYCAEDKARSQTGSRHSRGPTLASSRQLAQTTPSTASTNSKERVDQTGDELAESRETPSAQVSSSSIGLTSEVADATATVIIQHLLANNHLKSLQTNYSY